MDTIVRPHLATYQSLCTEIYDLSKPAAPSDAYAFYKSYALEAKGPILEPMCGTGRFLLPLQEEGFDIHGFDASEHMLNALYAKATHQDLNPSVWQGFIEHLHRSERYNLIFIPSGSFGLITDLDVAQKALQTLYDHLNPKGILVFETDANVPKSVPLVVWKGSVWPKSDGTMIVASSLTSVRDGVCHASHRYEHVSLNQLLHREIEELEFRLYSEPSLLIEMLKRAGFSEARTMKAFDRHATLEENDEVMVYECRK